MLAVLSTLLMLIWYQEGHMAGTCPFLPVCQGLLADVLGLACGDQVRQVSEAETENGVV